MEARRRCTMCGNAFEYTIRQGRPPAFCSQDCKSESRRNSFRYCIICEELYEIGRDDWSSPFYCSQACSTTKKLCRQCGLPTKFYYCSRKCVLAKDPLPWTCTVCSRSFEPELKWWDFEPRALNEKKKYCSSDCYERRRKPTNDFWISLDQTLEWTMLRGAGMVLPIRADHPTIPFVGVDPEVVPDPATMPPVIHNSINFWRWVLNKCPVEAGNRFRKYDIFTHELAEGESICTWDVLFCMMAPNPTQGTPWEIMPATHLWPWLEPYITSNDYSRQDLVTWCQKLERAHKAWRKLHKAPSLEKIEELVMEADYALRVYKGFTDLKLDDPNTKNDKRKLLNFVKRYCTPSPMYATHNGYNEQGQPIFGPERTYLQRLWGLYLENLKPWTTMSIEIPSREDAKFEHPDWEERTSITIRDTQLSHEQCIEAEYYTLILGISHVPIYHRIARRKEYLEAMLYYMKPTNPFKMKDGQYTTEPTPAHDYNYEEDELPWGQDLRYEVAMASGNKSRMDELMELINSNQLTTNFYETKTNELDDPGLW